MSVNINITASAYLPEINQWYLSEHPHDAAKDPRYVILNHLASDKMIPITQNQHEIFDQSKKISTLTSKYLGWRGFSLIFSASVVAGVACVRIPKYSNISDESAGTDLVPFALATTAAFAAGVMGMIFTGTNPDKKSDKANSEQNEVKSLTETFNECSKYLINLFWSKKPLKHKKAIEIAEKIDIVRLRNFFKEVTTQEGIENDILEALETSILYVRGKGKGKPCKAIIEEAIHRQEMRKQCKVAPCLRVSPTMLSDKTVSSECSDS